MTTDDCCIIALMSNQELISQEVVNWFKSAGAVVDDFDFSEDSLIDITYHDMYIMLSVGADALAVFGIIGDECTWSDYMARYERRLNEVNPFEISIVSDGPDPWSQHIRVEMYIAWDTSILELSKKLSNYADAVVEVKRLAETYNECDNGLDDLEAQE